MAWNRQTLKNRTPATGNHKPATSHRFEVPPPHGSQKYVIFYSKSSFSKGFSNRPFPRVPQNALNNGRLPASASIRQSSAAGGACSSPHAKLLRTLAATLHFITKAPAEGLQDSLITRLSASASLDIRRRGTVFIASRKATDAQPKGPKTAS